MLRDRAEGVVTEAGERVGTPARAVAARAAVPFRVVSELSHVDEAGEVRMVDVGGKPLSRRRAVARAVLRVAPETASRLGSLPKGDALTTAKLAGIMAAKRTSELIPLCHPLPLTHVAVEIQVGDATRGYRFRQDDVPVRLRPLAGRPHLRHLGLQVHVDDLALDGRHRREVTAGQVLLDGVEVPLAEREESFVSFPGRLHLSELV